LLVESERQMRVGSGKLREGEVGIGSTGGQSEKQEWWDML
jgi:hypothetical protein